MVVQRTQTPKSERTGPRIVVYVAPEWPGRYLANQIAASGLNLVAVVFGPDPLDNVALRPARFQRAMHVAGIRPALAALFGFRYGLRESFDRLFRRDLAPRIEDLPRRGVPVHRVADFLSEGAHELLGRLEPDVVVLCGTPIVPESLLSIPRICALNIHTSLLPHYHGGGSTFWPLFFQDFKKVGYTIHKAVSQVDAGPYLYQEPVPVRKGDNSETLLRRALVIAAPKTVELLSNTKLDDPSMWKVYDKPIRYAWRKPDAAVRGYMNGSTLRQTAASLVRKTAIAINWSPYKIADGPAAAFFFWNRTLDPAVPATDWRRVLGHPTTQELRERIALIRKYFEIVPLTEAMRFLRESKAANGTRLAVLTVDDGYLDFRTNLMPLLEELNTPCSLFVSSGAIQWGTLWHQQVYSLIEGLRGDRLIIPWADCAVWFGDVKHRVLTADKVLNAYLKRQSAATRVQHLQELLQENNVTAPAEGPDAFCKLKDVLAIRKSPLIEVHLHSHGHHPFDTLGAEELADDLAECRHFFKSNLNLDDDIISYPNGTLKNGQEKILKAAGCKAGFTIQEGINHPGHINPFALKRIRIDSGPLPDLDWRLRKLLAAS